MYRQLLILLVLVSFTTGQHKKREANGDKYQLVWKEDFAGEELNQDDWGYEVSCKHLNEIQCSTKRREENVRIENGHLVIEARAEKYQNRQFTSGRLRTLKVWKYGRFQVRARLPRGKDLCPMIWMWPAGLKYGENGESGQMRLMQYRGDEPEKITSCMLFGGDWEHIVHWSDEETLPNTDLSNEFHTFGMEWTPVKISFSLDGKVYAERDIDTNLWGGHGQNPYSQNGQPFDKLFALVVHLSVGGEYCGQGTVTPEQARNWEKPTLEIDWIKVYQKEKNMVDKCEDGYQLIWSDEFEGKVFDRNKWINEVHCHPANHEQQCYTDNRTQNVRVKNGNLILEARPEEWTIDGQRKQFTSARFHSRAAWAYGKFLLSARLPHGYQLWPALWMWPLDDKKYGGDGLSGEIDIMEALGDATNKFASTLHFGGTGDDMVHWGSGFKTFNFDLSKDFHVYELVWSKKTMIFKLDDKEYWRRDIDKNLWSGKGPKNPYSKNGQPFDSPFFIIINIAVGGLFFGNGPYVTPEQARGWQKPTMEIDYVRVYQDCD